MRVRVVRSAEIDLEEGFRFYERQDGGLGSYFLDSLFSEIDSLAYFGGIHPQVFEFHRLLARKFPFAVYYRMIQGEVVVFAILDCRKHPSWARKRLTE